jgi:hypothetical protein
MQLQQSSVGKTLLRAIIVPPMLGSFSTSHAIALICQVKRSLHSSNAAANDQGIYAQVFYAHRTFFSLLDDANLTLGP